MRFNRQKCIFLCQEESETEAEKNKHGRTAAMPADFYGQISEKWYN